jgi:hypothetical protein
MTEHNDTLGPPKAKSPPRSRLSLAHPNGTTTPMDPKHPSATVNVGDGPIGSMVPSGAADHVASITSTNTSAAGAGSDASHAHHVSGMDKAMIATAGVPLVGAAVATVAVAQQMVSKKHSGPKF